MPFLRLLLRCPPPALVAEWTLDTAAAMIDCPPGLWKMSRADRAYAVRIVTRRLRKPVLEALRVPRYLPTSPA